MRRRTFISALAVMFVTLVMSLMATTNEAAAQHYTVDVDGFRDGCFKFELNTYWNVAFPVVTITGNGITTHPVAWACPPATDFFGASINGQFPIATYNEPVKYIVNGCCMVVRISFDRAGCPVITIRPC